MIRRTCCKQNLAPEHHWSVCPEHMVHLFHGNMVLHLLSSKFEIAGHHNSHWCVGINNFVELVW